MIIKYRQGHTNSDDRSFSSVFWAGFGLNGRGSGGGKLEVAERFGGRRGGLGCLACVLECVFAASFVSVSGCGEDRGE